MRRIHIFKPGLQTAMSGLQLNFSESDLAATAAAYDPALHEAPCVVGHPKSDGPAYGWAKSLTANADGLFAEPHQVNPEFAELVAAGSYKKISAAFYAPDHSANPVPGVYYLRHIGFLGAQPPAVKGLKGIEFADSDAEADKCVEIELDFSEAEEPLVWALADLVPTLRSLRDRIVEKDGVEEAEKALPSWRLDSMAESVNRAREALRKEVQPGLTPAFNESPNQESTTVTPEEKAALEARNAQLEADLAKSKAALRASAVAANTASHAAFAETLAADARIAPADKAVVTALLDFAEPAVIEGETVDLVEFGEGDAKQPIAAAIKNFLQALPKRVEFGEQASRQRAAEDGKADDTQYAEGTPPDAIAMDQRIRKYAADHKLTYAEAAEAVATGQA